MTAFKAAYADWKLIKTRGVIQVVMEVPLAEADAAYDVLGGMPNAANEVWFGIAALNLPQDEKENSKLPAPATARQDPKSAGPKRMDWQEVQPAAQAGIRSNEPEFWAFLREVMSYPDVTNSDTAAIAVRHVCRVNSRAEFSTDHRKRVLWHQLDTEYQAWLAKERIGA
jgi:hypothetical protein